MKIRHPAAVIATIGLLATLPACSTMHSMGIPTGSSTAMAQPELSPGMVKQVQTALQQQGMYQGNIDGVWGSATRTAVQNYQGSHGLTANGQLDAPTLKALNLSNNVPSGSAAMPPAAPATPAPATTTTQ
jgi:peptidoglycan hydrolase-like protein with peptidoglycan-binding domain